MRYREREKEVRGCNQLKYSIRFYFRPPKGQTSTARRRNFRGSREAALRDEYAFSSGVASRPARFADAGRGVDAAEQAEQDLRLFSRPLYMSAEAFGTR